MGATHKVLSPAPRDVWRELMICDPEAVPYQSLDWFEAICASGNYKDVSRFYEFTDGSKIILPLVQRGSGLPFMGTAASFPSGWGMGGLLVSTDLETHHVQSIIRDLARLPYLRLNIRPNPRRGALWADALAGERIIARPRRAHVIDLSNGFEDVWNNRFTRDTRSRVRKAERASIKVKCCTKGDLVPVLYDLLEKSVVRWAAKQNEPAALARWRFRRRDPIEKLHGVARTMGENCRIWAAWVDGKPVASLLVLTGANANDSKGAIDREALGTSGANDLIQKLAIEDACRLGCRYYHLGESGNSKSLSHFKERFGADPYPYSEYVFEKLPLTRIDAALRSAVKRTIGFRD